MNADAFAEHRAAPASRQPVAGDVPVRELPATMRSGLDALDVAYAATTDDERLAFERIVDDLLANALVPLIQAWDAHPAQREAIESEFADAVGTGLAALDGFPCHDCRTPTISPGEGRSEYYMVTASVWARAVSAEHVRYLCIGCLEARVGRTLTCDDFTDAPVNTDSDSRRTPRLTHRLSTRTLR